MSPGVVSIGEVLWDLLPSGAQLGGAPANLATLAAGLGADAALISRVGADGLGTQARAQLTARGVDVSAVSTDPAAPTGTVGVDLDAFGQPRFTIHRPAAWDFLQASPEALERVSRAQAVCFGTLAQRHPTARDALRALVSAAGASPLILCDINLRAPFCDPEVIEWSLRAAGTVKLNETELPFLANLLSLDGDTDAQVRVLAGAFNLDTVLLTLGAQGCRVWHRGVWFAEPGRPAAVKDTIGAGDSFTAAFVLGQLLGWPMQDTLRRATEIAAYVCTQSGATPELPGNLAAPFRA
ncbi:MAG: carbohydrate kinase [Verrucomicrobiae bacterium]|nr:carbohydrate kinase [Verrucomicrobiae bacterium]